MSGDKYALLILVVIAAALAAHRYTRNRKEDETTHGKGTGTEDLIKVGWRWPQWRKDISEALNHIHRHQLSFFKQQEKIMADAAEILAEARENTKALESVNIVLDAINENEQTIVDLIKKLKDEIGNNPILEELRVEVANQKQLIAGAKTAIGENLTPSGN